MTLSEILNLKLAVCLSNYCGALANWDLEQLARAVDYGTPAIFGPDEEAIIPEQLTELERADLSCIVSNARARLGWPGYKKARKEP